MFIEENKMHAQQEKTMGNLLFKLTPSSVMVTREGLAAFRKSWPDCGLPQHRPMSFIFDDKGDVIDGFNFPAYGYNSAALAALTKDAHDYLVSGRLAAWAQEEIVTEQRAPAPPMATVVPLPVMPKLKLYLFELNETVYRPSKRFNMVVQAYTSKQARELWTDWALSQSWGEEVNLRDYRCLLLKPNDAAGPSVFTWPKFVEEVSTW